MNKGSMTVMDSSANTTHSRDELAELKNREHTANEGLSIAEMQLKRRKEFIKKNIEAKVDEETPLNAVNILAVTTQQYPIENFELGSTHPLGNYTMAFHPLGIDVTIDYNAYPQQPLCCLGSRNTHLSENYNFTTMSTHSFSIHATNSYNEPPPHPLDNFEPEKRGLPSSSVKTDTPFEDFTTVLPYRMSKAMKEKQTMELATYLNLHPQYPLGNFGTEQRVNADAAMRTPNMKTEPPFEEFTGVLPYRMSKAMKETLPLNLIIFNRRCITFFTCLTSEGINSAQMTT
nr:uncharacterized protein LOC106621554 isoform X3 [Bactrocera oleae]